MSNYLPINLISFLNTIDNTPFLNFKDISMEKHIYVNILDTKYIYFYSRRAKCTHLIVNAEMKSTSRL